MMENNKKKVMGDKDFDENGQNPKIPPPGTPPLPPVLYQHLKIVRGPFFDFIFRLQKGLSGPRKTHGRPLAPEVKLVFVFSFSFFRLCGRGFTQILGVCTWPKGREI